MVGKTGSTRFEFEAKSDTGLVRNNNEDALIVVPGIGLFGVCDGLGGHAAGEVASSLAAATLEEYLTGPRSRSEQVLREAIQEANRRILNNQMENPAYHGMGTTISAIWIGGNSQDGWIGHVGDSRIYRYRDNTLTQITEDHSPVFQLYKEGVLTKEEMQHHPRKNLIERSLGFSSTITPDVFPVDIQRGDLYLICSDGLTDALSDEDIVAVLTSSTLSKGVDHLVAEANVKGGFDNITVVLVEILGIS